MCYFSRDIPSHPKACRHHEEYGEAESQAPVSGFVVSATALPLSKEGIRLAQSGMPELRARTSVFLHRSLLCILAVSHHMGGQLCFRSSGETLFS